MFFKKAGGAFRAARRRVSGKRLVMRAPKDRAGLMRGTSIFGGVVAPFAAKAAKPRPHARWLKWGGVAAAGVVGSFIVLPAGVAFAACTASSGSNNPATITCTSSGAGTTLSSANRITADVGFGPGSSTLAISSYVGVTESGAASNVDVNVRSDTSSPVTITSSGSNVSDLSISDTATNRTGIITVTTDTYSTLTNTGTGSQADGIRVIANGNNTAATTNGAINVTSNSTMSVKQDGIHIEEDGTGSTGGGLANGTVTVNNYGAITAGNAGGSSGNVDWNGVSVQTTGGNININTAQSGTITMAGGNQSAIWAKSDTGAINVDIDAGIGAVDQNTGGNAVQILSGGKAGSTNYQGGNVSVTLEEGNSVYSNATGVLIGQSNYFTTTPTVNSTTEVINYGSITAYGSSSNGIQVGGFNENSGGTKYHAADISGEALYSDVTIVNEDGASINAGGSGVVVSAGGGTISLTNAGHISGANGDGANLGGTSSGYANSVTVQNHSLGSMIGSTNGQEISYTNTTDYNNEGGLTAGLNGNGLNISNIYGLSSDPNQYAVTVENTVEDHGSAGGIIVGSSSGVTVNGVGTSLSYTPGKNGVLIDNSGSGYGSHKKPGGLIVGEAANGVSVTGANADVTIDNSNTRNGAGNDLTTDAIDAAVGYDNYMTGPKDTLLDKLTSYDSGSGDYTYNLNYVLSGDYAPDAPDGGISTGIWGGGSGIYEQNIAGIVTVDNSKGQIFGSADDGIRLWDVGSGVTGDLSQTVVDIDNSHGLVEGGTNGANLQGIQNGSLYYDNRDGTTLGGTNGIYVGVANVEDTLGVAGNVTIQNEDGLIGGQTGNGISIDKVGGSVSISNDKGWGWWGDGGTIAGGTNGIVASNIGGVFSLDNERGLTVGYNGDGVNVSNVAGAGLGDYDAVYVDNTDGGLIAGSGNGIVISSVTGDSEDGVYGDANNIYIDNSAQIGDCDTVPGGLIVGVTGNGISVTNVLSTNSEGAVSGSVTINNQNTLGTTIDLADYGSGIYEYNCEADPTTTGLLGAAGFGGQLEDLEGGEQVTGIFGDTNGVYGSNIGGDVAVLNEDGLIVGNTADGIHLLTIGGDVFITNEDNGNGGGWIEGRDGGIVAASVTGNFTALNAGGTVWGDQGDGVNVTALGGAFYLDNSDGGSTVGYIGTGVFVEGVSGNVGNAEISNAVGIDNTDGGLIAGSSYGIYIGNVTGNSATEGVVNNVYINNSADPWNCDPTSGGLIVGVDSDGIHISNVIATGDGAVSGNVTIDNHDTLATTIDLANFGSEVYQFNYDDEDSWATGLLGGNDYGWWCEGTQTTGIFGGTNGIYANNVGGNFNVYNEDGLIVGDDGDGIQLSEIGGNVEIDNGYTYVETHDGYDGSWFDGQGGSIWGRDNGISLTDITGDVTINNALGWIVGDNEDGIVIQGDDGAGADHVYVYNGEYNSDSHDWVNGGTILGEESAISIADVTSVEIANGSLWWDCDYTAWGGLILGGGGEYAAIDLRNMSAAVGGGATIVNQGIIASSDDDTFNPWNTAQNYYDSLDIWNAVASGNQSIYGSLDNLADYGASAANKAIATSGETDGATQITNYGLIVGSVNLTGATDNGEDGYYGNTFTNYWAWFTSGDNTFSGLGVDTIHNEGLIQTAFAQMAGDAPANTNATFTVADFYNDTPEPEGYTGILSSLDEQAGDTITINGNFHGGSYAAESEDGVYSLVALDAYLDAPAPGGNPSADELIVTGDASGTTGLIINNTNPNDLNAGDMNEDGIQVVQVDDSSNGCVDTACVDGDSFYISGASKDYIAYNGVGMIQQGSFYAWYLTERTGDANGDQGGEGYYLATTALPDSYQAPAVTTGFVNIFYAGTGLVSDHLYGGHFPAIGSGGGGDDVTPQGPDQSKTNAAVWARVSGSWSTQDSSVNTGATTYDTSFKQDTYTLLGGVDMSPNGGASGLRFGAYGGYVTSSLGFSSYGTSGKYTGGEVGAYAAYTQGGFYVDTQVDADFLNVDYNATVNSTPITGSTNGTTLGVLANVGNRFYRGANFFEPLASVSYANMTLGDIDTGSATVSFSDSQSLRGGVGARIGTTVKGKGSTLTEFTLLGRLWNEFEGDSTVTVSDGTNVNTFHNDIGGLYEEVQGTVTFADTRTYLSTFLSGGAMFGVNSTTLNAKAGVRKEF